MTARAEPHPRCGGRAIGFAGVIAAACATVPPVTEPTPVAGPAWFPLPPALAARPATIPVPPLKFEPEPPQRQVLDNGLVLHLLADRTVALITVRAMIRLGSIEDPPDRAGLADATLATMRAGGAGKRSPEELDEAVDAIGAELWASAGRELSEVGLSVLSRHQDRALELFADVLRRPSFAEGRVAQVLDRARELMRRREDSPGGLAFRAFEKAVHGRDSPFARESTLATLGRLARADLVDFHRRGFAPGAVRIVASGDFDPGEMTKRLSALFGEWARGDGLRRRLPDAVPQPTRQVILVPKSIAQAKIRIGHPGFKRHDPREHALRLVDAVLGGVSGPTRVHLSLRERSGLAYSAGSSLSPGPLAGLFLLSADAKPENAARAVEALLGEGKELVSSRPVTAAELARAQEVYVNAYAFRFDTADKSAYEHALHEFHGYPDTYLRDFRRRIDAVTVDEINAAARSLLSPDATVIVVVGDPAKLPDLGRFGPLRTVRDVTAFE